MEKSGNVPSRLTCFRRVTALMLLVTLSLGLVYGLRMQDVSFAMANWRSINGYHDDKSTAASPEESVPMKTILLWNKFFKEDDYGAGGLGQVPFIKVGCPVTACRLTTNNVCWPKQTHWSSTHEPARLSPRSDLHTSVTCSS